MKKQKACKPEGGIALVQLRIWADRHEWSVKRFRVAKNKLADSCNRRVVLECTSGDDKTRVIYPEDLMKVQVTPVFFDGGIVARAYVPADMLMAGKLLVLDRIKAAMDAHEDALEGLFGQLRGAESEAQGETNPKKK